MKAAVTTEDHGFEVVDLPDPTPASDQLVIRVAACGVCGSDIKAQPYAPAGMVMGHELGGEVVAVGSGADGWREGTNVAVLPVISCGTCQYCRTGSVSHCAEASYIGMGPAGGFAEYAVVPARHSFALPAELPTRPRHWLNLSRSDCTVFTAPRSLQARMCSSWAAAVSARPPSSGH